MAIRFRRSIKIAPGIRVNISKSGLSLSLGPKGATFTVGRNGVYGNFSIPGTGISCREKLISNPSSGCSKNDKISVVANRESPNTNSAYASLGIDPKIFDELTAKANSLTGTKAERKREFASILVDEVGKMNATIEKGIHQHLLTPTTINRMTLGQDGPKHEALRLALDISICVLFGFLVLPIFFIPKIISRYKKSICDAQQKMDEERRNLNDFYDGVDSGLPENMRAELERVLSEIDFYIAVRVNFEVASDGKAISFKIELPSIEKMPGITFVARKTTLEIKAKAKNDKDRIKEHEIYNNGVIFRVISTAFMSLPSVELIKCVGFENAYNDADGRQEKKIIIECKFTRDQWIGIDFYHANPLHIIPKNRLEDTGYKVEEIETDSGEEMNTFSRT